MNKVSYILRARSYNVKQITYNTSNIARLLTTNVDEKIEIPNRIHRGPTDILRALESTISKDPTAAHYKYHDDPFLIPMSNIGKRTFAMAQEAGRKAAHWVREEHPDLFQHKECDPPIKAFFPKMVYNENTNVNESDLKYCIQNVFVSDANNVYKLLNDKGIKVSDDVRQSLLELLCYYNNEDTLPEDFIEERWFKQSTRGKEKQRKTWKDGSTAEEIFISIENPNSAAYSALIQGMAKYYHVDRAYQLYEEAQTKGLILTTEAYNSIISVSNFLKESYEMRWNFVMDVLISMQKAEVKPNLATLNATLEITSTMGIARSNKLNVLKILKEFQLIGIEPSLSSWYYVLISYCKERGPISTILKDILPLLENKDHTIRDIKDTYFFVTAMDICRNHLHQKELAQRVNNLLHYGNNYDLIGDSYKESIYYRHYFILMCETEPLDDFMENIYNKFVPHIYVPEPAVMGEILRTVEINAAIEYLPKLWSDMTVFDHTDREPLLHSILSIMVENKPDVNSELHEQFANIGWGIWNKIENQHENRIHKLTFTGEMLGKIMMVVLRNNDFEKANEVMNKLDKGHNTVIGVPKVDVLSLYIDKCIEEKLPSKAIQCIQYCADCGFAETESFAAKLNKNMTLDETHLDKLAKIVGEHVLDRNVNIIIETAK